jgi:hypothetical protein
LLFWATRFVELLMLIRQHFFLSLVALLLLSGGNLLSQQGISNLSKESIEQLE